MEQEYVGWPLYHAFGTYELTTKGFNIDLSRVKVIISNLLEREEIVLSKKFLGSSKNWDSFDGRFAIRGD